MGQGILKTNSKIDFKDQFTIANGATESGAIFTHGDVVSALRFPAAFNGDSVSFKCAEALDGTYIALLDNSGALYTVPVTVSSHQTLDLLLMNTVNYVKIVCSEAQDAERTITAVSQPV